jgi:ssDNA-binding Zn-finger/Zn-ribbon topoisomerase 1
LSDDDVQKIIGILEKNNIREFVDDRQHVKNIRASARDVYATISAGICPKCGGRLVERRGKYGSFYGCSNYPKCKFTTQ